MKTYLYMTHDLINIPTYPLPDGYQFYFLSNPKEMGQWANILTAAGEFDNEKQAIERFKREFKPNMTETTKRMILLMSPDGQNAATATAWLDEYQKQTIGRLHWVAVHPDYQGGKLGKPLIAKAMNVLAHYHSKTYLRTQPRNLTAIRIYLQFGFQPLIRTEEDKEVWDTVYGRLPGR